MDIDQLICATEDALIKLGALSPNDAQGLFAAHLDLANCKTLLVREAAKGDTTAQEYVRINGWEA